MRPLPGPSDGLSCTQHTGQLVGFVDAAHANDLLHCLCTTGYAFLLNFGVILYCSKTQSTTVISSTEAEFLAAVTAANHTKHICAVLLELGYPQHGPSTKTICLPSI